eukprot:m.338125 g.338125  ORF g.338125 m.338125 type:complete len:225 (+) comp18319_c0_seq1:378-1052(+)
MEPENIAGSNTVSPAFKLLTDAVAGKNTGAKRPEYTEHKQRKGKGKRPAQPQASKSQKGHNREKPAQKSDALNDTAFSEAVLQALFRNGGEKAEPNDQQLPQHSQKREQQKKPHQKQRQKEQQHDPKPSKGGGGRQRKLSTSKSPGLNSHPPKKNKYTPNEQYAGPQYSSSPDPSALPCPPPMSKAPSKLSTGATPQSVKTQETKLPMADADATSHLRNLLQIL